MSKITPINRAAAFLHKWRELTQQGHIAVTETAEGNLLISQPSHSIRLSPKQAAFVLPHLERFVRDREID